MALDTNGRARSNDLIALSGVLRVCELELVLVGSESPGAETFSFALNDAIIFSGTIDFSLRGRFVLPPDWCLFGLIHCAEDGGWCHGTPLEEGMAFTVLPDGSSEFALRGGSTVSVVLVPLEKLQRKFAGLRPLQVDLPSRLLSLFTLSGTRQAQALRAQFGRLRERLTGEDGSPPTGEDVEALLESHILAGIAAAPEDRPQCSRGRRAHYLIMQRAEQFMRANMRQDIYITEMCNAAGVSERALRYAFEDLLGLSPNRYLSMLRLCAAYRSLSMSDASRRSVKSVALSSGLWDLSRFADHYRRVFGESPRDTLMRAPPPELGEAATSSQAV